MTPTEIRAAILAYYSKHGRTPHYASIGPGVDYFTAEPVFKAMIADGTLVYVTIPSKTGRKMRHLRPSQGADTRASLPAYNGTTAPPPAEILERDFAERLAGFLRAAQAHIDYHHKASRYMGKPSTLSVDPNGKRYLRIVSSDDHGSRYVYCFVDTTTGAICKAGGWKAPARNPVRGSIFADDFGASCVNWHGTVYLR